ncbi:class Ib ribonucleoside-diphosphate reductase assembly flavoprotein NrdI [Deinococcus sp. HMF7620]|uniref:Class Ib ribonucleoside-diphosphate reductase assembly flavoprotein NrdI n=1 Tax=Deinococcus arboris TaxID=2682977 RepID=A0A7C9M233_9DEIO|nr:class Ib ribonucleoside-diphosphate reductase assembly flavoprotein NrdI [Deinococcus arboris]MVN87242.1 class Ib ribonucleoside-diphosphate reductase assembly flavoprotein NrdI [Deinococcus arboris]
MHLIVDSLTGNVRRFAQAVAQAAGGLTMQGVQEARPQEPYLLLTYTFGQGQVPASTQAFLRRHRSGLCGVVSSGSYHWGANFARAGALIAADYQVPLVAQINKSGTAADREQVLTWLRAAAAPLPQPQRTPTWTPGLN